MSKVSGTPFGVTKKGEEVWELTLDNGTVSCKIITFGAAVRTLTVPGRGGAVDVVLGYDTLAEYEENGGFFGAVVGRYANRIAGGRFALNGREYTLARNDGPNHLHGGEVGYSHRVWTVEEAGADRAVLTLDSPDGEEGYPGTLRAEATYTLRDGELLLWYQASCDKDTPCSLTNHTYFNLSGHDSGSVEGQYIKLYASRYTPTAPGSIPTGEIAPVEGTPMDLRTAQPIGAHIGDPFDQLVMARGYDHNWVIDGFDDMAAVPAARAWSPETGICLEAATTQPGVQFYTGNYVGGCPAGKGGAAYGDRHGFCLETQCFPDSPNQPNFSPWVLWAGSEYRSGTVYRFSIIDRADQL